MNSFSSFGGPSTIDKTTSESVIIISKFLKKKGQNPQEKEEDANNETIEKCVKFELISWVKYFTGHGFLHIFTANSKVAKVVWSSSILASIALTIYYIVSTLIQFLSHEIVTSIRVFKPEEIDFPAVTFCEDSNNLDFDTDLKALDCSYHKRKCDFFDIFEKVTILYWGVLTTCLRFNTRMLNATRPVEKTERSGWEFSLYLVLYFPKHLDFYIGHNTYEPTFYNIAGVINPGILTDLIITKTIQNNLGEPYNKCLKSGETFDSDLFRETIRSGYEYRQVNCYDLCLQKQYIAKCRDLVNVAYNNDCYTNLTANFNFKGLCEQYCPLECDSVSIQTSIQTLNFDAITWPVMPAAHANASYNLSSVFSIWIYYDNIEYTQIDQIPKMSLPDLIASVGGMLGLFLGLSFISLLEIGQLLARLFVRVIFRRKENVSMA